MNKSNVLLVLGLAGIAATLYYVHQQQKMFRELAERGHKVKIGNGFFYAQLNG